MKAVVIEDEQKTREAIASVINSLCDDTKVVATAHNVKTGIEIIRNYHPGLVLTDVMLSDGTAFDILKQVSTLNFKIIFVTAHEGYTLQAIKFNAFDYILKPFKVKELLAAIKNVKKESDRKKNKVYLDSLLHSIEEHEHKRIVIKTADELQLVNISNIINCVADSSYTNIYLKDGSYLTASTNIKEYEELLKDNNFFRVHHSNLVNLDEVKKYHKSDKPFVLMSNGKEIPVSHRKKESLLKAINSL